MQLHVQFYSHLRDLAATAELPVEVAEGAFVGDLLEQLYLQRPALRAADKTILVAAGVEFVDRQYRLQPNDDISIMPPVQGG